MYLQYLKDTKRNKGDSQAYQTYVRDIQKENDVGVGGGSTVSRMIIIDDPRYLWHDNTYPLGCGSYPVTMVSIAEAEAYCKWLTERHKSLGTFRLPTKAEWMITAYGRDRLYPWGDKWDIEIPYVSRSWGKSDLRTHPTQVGRLTKDVTPEGVVNLWGNIGEIVSNRDYAGVEWMGGSYNSYPWTDGTPFVPRNETWGGYDNPTSVLQSVGFRVLLQPANRDRQWDQNGK